MARAAGSAVAVGAGRAIALGWRRGFASANPGAGAVLAGSRRLPGPSVGHGPYRFCRLCAGQPGGLGPGLAVCLVASGAAADGRRQRHAICHAGHCTGADIGDCPRWRHASGGVGGTLGVLPDHGGHGAGPDPGGRTAVRPGSGVWRQPLDHAGPGAFAQRTAHAAGGAAGGSPGGCAGLVVGRIRQWWQRRTGHLPDWFAWSGRSCPLMGHWPGGHPDQRCGVFRG